MNQSTQGTSVVPKCYGRAVDRLQRALSRNAPMNHGESVDRVRRLLFGPLIDQIQKP